MEATTESLIQTLKFLNDILVEYTKLLEKVNELENKYGITFNSITGVNLTSGQTVDLLSKKLSLEQLGLLFIVSSEIQSIGDFNKYFTYEPQKQQEIRAGLRKASEMLTKIVAGN